MEKQSHKQIASKEDKSIMQFGCMSRQYRIAILSLTTLFLGTIAYALVSPTTNNTLADTITNTAGSTSEYYVSLTSNSLISLSVTPDNNIHTVTDTITATSNTGSGYKVFVSMANDDTNGNRLYLNGDTTSSSYISPTDTTSTNLPTNSWGVSVATEDPEDPTTSNVYTAMPLQGNELAVRSFTSDIPLITIPVVYGAKVDAASPAGTYKGEILYSVLANSPINTILSTTTAYTSGGGTLTISTPLMNSLDLDETTPTATVSIGTMVDGTLTDVSVCTDPTIAINSNTGIYEVTCNLPAKAVGSYDVVVDYTGAGLQDDTTRSYTASSKLTYVVPTISSVSPDSRYTTGTQSITILTNIAKDTPMTVTSAQVGTTANNCADPQVTNSGDYRAITCMSPSLSAGTYNVSADITIDSGDLATITTDNAITYTDPVISSVSPSTDLHSSGGQTLTVVLNIASSTAISNASVTVGGTTCTSPSITTSGSYRAITCTTPAKTAGTYDIATSFTLNGDTASLSLANAVTYKTDLPQFFEITTMQEMTQSICNTVDTPGSSVTKVTVNDGSDYETGGTIIPSHILKDTRDDQEYTVRKLADGNCWMMENLRFGSTPANAARAWDSTTDPDLTDGNANVTKMASLNNAAISNASNCGSNFTDSHYTDPQICIYQANTPATYDSKTKFGVLYNYCAATGGTVCNSSSMSTDAPGSVCPKGWKLPGMTATPTGSGADTSGTTKTYNNLANAYGVTNGSAGFYKIIAEPLNFVRSGFANGDWLFDRSSSGVGNYWSSTKNTAVTKAYDLDFNSSHVYQDSDGIRYGGQSIRCVSSS